MPVLFTLPLTSNAASGKRSKYPGMLPPVEYQLHKAEMIYRLTRPFTSISLHPSPSVAFPPFTISVPLKMLMSAAGPVRLAFVEGERG